MKIDLIPIPFTRNSFFLGTKAAFKMQLSLETLESEEKQSRQKKKFLRKDSIRSFTPFSAISAASCNLGKYQIKRQGLDDPAFSFHLF
jgi:hypothetical protein